MTQPSGLPPRHSRRARRAARRSWYLVIPVALFGWNAAVLLGYLAYLALFEYCPKDLIADGRCVAAWFDPAERLVSAAAAGLGALLAIVLAILVEPVRPVVVTWVVCAIGTAIAALIAWLARAPEVVIVAATSGLITAAVVTWWYRKHDQTREATDRR